ncbi:deoxynucleoside kinase [Ligilactobacillus salitolerans]|uniref:deoxynucleoside kinase n=1 Tax=Ligilactobacillus salitolerans TaxID=1808352 RepID=UPI000F60CCDC|nr:deoxynucleoside kinase [Ligilactobacillus salitolerans]
MITIEGPIAAGKTSLTELLSTRLNSTPFYEPVSDNPVLPLFYQGNKAVAAGKWKTNPYAFLLQIFFLNRRFKMIKQAFAEANNVLDRSIYTDALFCKMNYERGNMTKVEWETYQELLANMLEELPNAAHKKAPDLMIYIDVSYETMLHRIKLRGRDYELPAQDPSLESYYQDLLERYRSFKKGYQTSPLLVLDGDRYDFVHQPAQRDAVLRQIYTKLARLGQLSDQEHEHLLEELTN